MYNNTTVKPLGTCQLKLINPKNEDKFKAEFKVVKDKTLTPLLDNKAVQAMNLMTRQVPSAVDVLSALHFHLAQDIVLQTIMCPQKHLHIL
jgi:hypothetical protein